MKVLAIIDSFKGTLTSSELGRMATEVLYKRNIQADYLPISDGGDGFLESIERIINTKRVYVKVLDPLKRAIETYYLLDDEKNTAYIELAKSSGINLLTKDELNPFVTSTYGLGQVINHAIDTKVKSIVVGLGGSATNDGGTGMLEALGCLFYNGNKQRLENLSGGKLDQIAFIDPTKLNKRLEGIDFTVLSDVTNPLLYENGASFIYAKQKGASLLDLPVLDRKMENYSFVIEEHLKQTYWDKPGAGAAGGVGFAFHSLLKAKFYSGIEYLLDLMQFEKLISDYDYIITGEGKIDNQSLAGKVILGITKRSQNKKIILVCAINELDESLLPKNIKTIYQIVGHLATLEESLINPHLYFAKLCEEITFNGD